MLPVQEHLDAFLQAFEENRTQHPDKPLVLPTQLSGPLQALSEALHLDSFEQAVLSLALAQELYPIRTRTLCAEYMGYGGEVLTASLTPHACIQWFDTPNWGAFMEDAPLRRWGLIRLLDGLSPDTSMRIISVAPGVLAYACGHEGLDPDVKKIGLEEQAAGTLSASQEELLKEAGLHLKRGDKDTPRGVLFYGTDAENLQAMAFHLLRPLGRVLRLDVAAYAALPPAEAERTLHALGREVRLHQFRVMLDATGDLPEGQDFVRPLSTLLDMLEGPAAVIASEPVPLETQHVLLPFAIQPPSPEEQRAQWAVGLNVPDNDPGLWQLGDQFRFSLHRIDALARETRLSMPAKSSRAQLLAQAWERSKTVNRRLMGSLAQKIDVGATWDDLILSDAEFGVLKQIAAHVRFRAEVYDQLGLARPGRGRALTALFSGPSGTGKTLSAEVLAGDLNLDLYRIDLSSTISKYIGETEKNLRKIFDAADQGGCILLFDEADSIFGKRGEVKDSNDRYANVQVNYLLQRLESFNGLALLTTNLESGMDKAFMRRIQFVLNFRPPGPPERERLWRGVFPKAMDTSDLDFRQLARADFAGGNIKSIATNAVFMAVARGGKLTQDIVNEALQLEYRKLGRLAPL